MPRLSFLLLKPSHGRCAQASDAHASDPSQTAMWSTMGTNKWNKMNFGLFEMKPPPRRPFGAFGAKDNHR
jgi:hypothetical protein